MIKTVTLSDGIGYVSLEDVMGNDLAVVNDARISFGKRSYELSKKDERLIRWLWLNQHTSPFRHSFLKYTIKMPIYVARQWMKHQVGCAWNEISGRYVKLEEFFQPKNFREQAEDVKQGSGGNLKDDVNKKASSLYYETTQSCLNAYHKLLDLGVCKEQARGVLPFATYTECRWTTSLQALINFLELRGEGTHAQKEIQEYAKIILELSKPYFETAFEVSMKKNGII